MRAIVLCLLLTGCASRATLVHGPNGPAKLIECGMQESACYERAARECPQGYRILDNHRTFGADLNLLVECK